VGIDRVNRALGADVFVNRKLTKHLTFAIDRGLLSITGNRVLVYLDFCRLRRY
jgi:hypothetical protein